MSKLVRLLDLIRVCKNWIAVLANRIWAKPLAAIELRSGIKFLVKNRIEKAELAILADIWQRHIYDPDFLPIGESDAVVDIGAHKGYFSVYAAKKAGRGKVYSFEPLPRLSQFITANSRINKLANIVVNNAAVWSKPGPIDLYVSSNSGGSSVRPKPSSIETVKVQSFTLEDFCDTNQIDSIDFLKLDCEGAEYDILLTLPVRVIRMIKKIAMEIHDFDSHHHSQIKKHLTENNFKVTINNGYLYAFR
ncbi:MAG: FkbM family methyltransferase [Candidatus Doudnabacteria bacterium]